MPTILYRETPKSKTIEVDVGELSALFGRPITWAEQSFMRGKVPPLEIQKERRFIVVKTSDPEIGFTVIANVDIEARTPLFFYPGEICDKDRLPTSHHYNLDKDRSIDGYEYLGFGSLLPALPTKSDLEKYAVCLNTPPTETTLLTDVIATANIKFERWPNDQCLACASRKIEEGETIGLHYFHTTFFTFAEHVGHNYQLRLFFRDGGDVIPYDMYQVNMPRMMIPHKENLYNRVEGHVPKETVHLYDAHGARRVIIHPGDDEKNCITYLTDFPSELVGKHYPHTFLVGIKPVEEEKIHTRTLFYTERYLTQASAHLNKLCSLRVHSPFQWKYVKEQESFLLETTAVSEQEQKRIQAILENFDLTPTKEGEKTFFKIPYAVCSHHDLEAAIEEKEKRQETQRKLREKYISAAPTYLNNLSGLQNACAKWFDSKQYDALMLEVTRLPQEQQKNIQRIVKSFDVISASGAGRRFFKIPYAKYVDAMKKMEGLCPEVQQVVCIMQHGVFAEKKITRLISEYASETSPPEEKNQAMP